MTRGELAAEKFASGYNCAQAVLLAFCDKTGLDETTAAKLTSGFGGGIGRLREVCGAANGAFMVISLLYGDDGIAPRERKGALYARIQDFAARFKTHNGSYLCRELLTGVTADRTPLPDSRTAEYYKKRPCAEIVRDAADMLETYLEENPIE
ncbi:MAG: C_GCAxxG_C_C family protein [Oscillospiraceae bacterium]|nr:C_GCAxxG_C_C family protein [Oscillospiraceae bacterium]